MYQIEVHHLETDTWKPLTPTHGVPYQYQTEGVAKRMALMLYPDHEEFVRVVRLDEVTQ